MMCFMNLFKIILCILIQKKRSINVTTVGGSDKVYNETPYGVKQFKGTPAKCDIPPIIHVLFIMK